LLTALAPGSDKMSKHAIHSGDGAALIELITRLRAKATTRSLAAVRVVTIQEAGLDGFWIHRLLQANDCESYVVDAGSIAVSRRRRRAKTDAIDGETLLRTLLAWKRGEPRVCAMVVPPTPEQEDRRRISRERAILMRERVRHTNRIKGLLVGQGITGYEPLQKDRRARLLTLKTGDSQQLGERLQAELSRELDVLELLLEQLRQLNAENEAAIETKATDEDTPGAVLARLKGIGPQIAAVLWFEGLYRKFSNRREVAAYAGLAPTPWRSGSIDREQGISKAGNRRLRHIMIELAWLWVRHQPDSTLTRWFQERVGTERGRVRRVAIVALARKLLIALWRYLTHGEIPEGAALKPS
jgi:transposase